MASRLVTKDEDDRAHGRSPADAHAWRDRIDDPSRSNCTLDRATTPNSPAVTTLVEVPS